MANENIREVSPLITPDSIRTTLNFLNAFNETHTKRFNGYEDINGSKYVGTVENFGDEILIESRKMLMDRPSLKRLFDVNTFGDYFDISYSELSETYTQQNMIIASLKKDVLLDYKEYSIILYNCEMEESVRSTQDGDDGNEQTKKYDNAYAWESIERDQHSHSIITSFTDKKGLMYLIKDKFYSTRTTPILKIDDDEIPLRLEFEFDPELTSYKFHKNISTDDFGIDITDNLDGTYNITIPLSSKLIDLPILWITNDLFATTPTLDVTYNRQIFSNSEAFNALSNEERETVNQINFDFIVGADNQGNKIVYLKPYRDDGVQLTQHNSFGISYEFDAFSEAYDPAYVLTNKGEEVSYIRIYLASSDGIFGWITYTYNNEEVRLSLRGPGAHVTGHGTQYESYTENWNIGRFEEHRHVLSNELVNGMMDELRDKYVYKYTCERNFFLSGLPEEDDSDVYPDYDVNTPLFDLRYKETYFPFNGDRGNNVSGIHIDAGTDYNNHAVIKDNGIIHELDQFDGLPIYFKSLKDRDIHRSHVELYTIRDRLDRINQHVYAKQTAGLILDSAVPQDEIKQLVDNDDIVIYYKGHSEFGFYKDKITSTTNALSEITFTDENTFSLSRMTEHEQEQKFTYHGNRTFSLGLMGFDPEMEKGRVYAITNDPIRYSNNGSNERAPRTLARICDIPTDFGQLMHIENTSPTLVFDQYYTRTETNCTTEILNKLWNECCTNPVIVRYEGFSKNKRWIHQLNSDDQPLRVWFHRDDLENEYYTVNNFGAKLDLHEAEFNIFKSGKNYKVGDTFYFIIGGYAIDGTVTSVTEPTGEVTGYSVSLPDDAITDPNNMRSYSQSFNTENHLSENGSGLMVNVTFTSAYWNSMKRVINKETLNPNMIAFSYDPYQNIWIWKYDTVLNDWVKATQMTGTPVRNYKYDLSNPIARGYRSFNDVLIYNLINSNNIINHLYAEDPGLYRISEKHLIEVPNSFNFEFDNKDLLLDYNADSRFYAFEETGNSLSVRLHAFDFLTPSYNNKQTNRVLLPRFNKLNINSISNKSNKFMVSDESVVQPKLYLFMPNRSYNIIHEEEPLFQTSSRYMIDNRKLITYDDFLYVGDDDDIMWIQKNGTVISNIYQYNEFAIPKAYDTVRQDVLVLPRSSKETLYTDFYNIDNDVVHNMNDSTFDALYEINRYISKTDSSYYIKPDPSLITYIHTQVVEYSDDMTDVKPISKQPTGAFVDVTTEAVDINATVNDKKVCIPPMYVFELESDIEEIPSDYHIYDENNNDITSLCMIIQNTGNLTSYGPEYYKWIYVSATNKNGWIKIK